MPCATDAPAVQASLGRHHQRISDDGLLLPLCVGAFAAGSMLASLLVYVCLWRRHAHGLDSVVGGGVGVGGGSGSGSLTGSDCSRSHLHHRDIPAIALRRPSQTENIYVSLKKDPPVPPSIPPATQMVLNNETAMPPPPPPLTQQQSISSYADSLVKDKGRHNNKLPQRSSSFRASLQDDDYR